MQSAGAPAAFWGAFGAAEMHTGATSGAAPTEAIQQAVAPPAASPAASQCSSPTRQSPRRRLSGLFSKLALLSVVMLAAAPTATACRHDTHAAQHDALDQRSAARRLRQAAGPKPATVDYNAAVQLATANNVANQPQGRRTLTAPRTCAYDDDAEASPEAEVRQLLRFATGYGQPHPLLLLWVWMPSSVITQ
jgi:hypothetical protein